MPYMIMAPIKFPLTWSVNKVTIPRTNNVQLGMSAHQRARFKR